jgi:hypothetical protein
MAHTVLNTDDTTTLSVSGFEAADKTNYVLVDQRTNDKDTVREAIYQSKSSDQAYPKTARVGFYKSPQANDGVGSKSISIRLETYVQKTDASSDEIWTKPLSCVLSTNSPGELAVPDKSAWQALVMEAASFMIQIASGAVATSNDPSDDLALGIVTTATEYENTGA